MGAYKAGSIHLSLGIEHALRKAGGDDELLEAMMRDSDVATAMIEAGKRVVRRKEAAKEAAIRRGALCIALTDKAVFTTRVRNLLMRRRVFTLGQLSMMSIEDIEGIHRMGGKGALEVMQVLATYGLDLRSTLREPAEHALWLYGEAEYIPAPFMMLWAPRLDGRTKDILTSYETLGQLVTITGNEFMHDAYGYRDGELSRTPKAQMLKVLDGLRQVGLTFRGE